VTELKIKYYLAYINFALKAIFIALSQLVFKKDKRQVLCMKAFEDLGLELQTKGVLHEDTDMLLINHQSHVDIYLLEAISNGRNLSWIAKEELLKIPFLGYMLKEFKMILVQRENKAGLIKLLKDVKDRVDNKRVVCIFPEGTRVKTQQLKKFKGGAKMIASKLELKVQPVVVVGSNYMLDSVEKVHRKVNPKVIFLPQVDLSLSSWYEDAQQAMQEVIDYEYKHNHCRR
jgi:1-acyl-sn-glycerol-3-phosphate acyltransferase